MNMAREEESDYILVGKVVKPHGIKGEIKILPFSGDPANFNLFAELLLVDPRNDKEFLFRVLRARIQGKMVIASLAGIENRNDSELQVGREVWVRMDELPALGEDEFYWEDLKGLRVVCENGRELGVVSNLLTGGGQEVLVITGRGREYMIPAVSEFMKKIDTEQGLLVVDPPPGLLEMNR